MPGLSTGNEDPPKRKPFGTENLPSLAVIAHVSIVNPDPSAAQFLVAPRGLRSWLFRRSVRSRRVKASRPVFADKVVPEKVVRLFVIEFESRALVEASSLQLHVLSPQHDAGVAGSGGEPEALVDQPTPYSRPARRRFDEQQA